MCSSDLTPIRSAPTVNGGRVFVITLENQVVALAANDGRKLWTYSGASTPTVILGGTAPAVDGGVVVAALVAVNAWGDVIDPASGKVVAGARKSPESRELVDSAAVLRHVPGSSEVKVEQTTGLPVLTVHVDRQKAARYGLNVTEVQDVVAAAVARGGGPRRSPRS